MNAVLHGGAPWNRSEEGRAFNYAVAGSLILHALLLFVFPALRQPAARPEIAPAPIVARLVQPPSAPLAAPKSQEEPASTAPLKENALPPVAKRASPPKANARAEAEPKAAPTPAPLATSQVAPTPSSAEDASSTAAPSSAPPAPAPVAKAEPLAVPSAPRPQTADPGSLAQYRLQLIAAARRYKRYPRVAMENNWEGAAEITMLIGLNGAISSATIKTSSGYEVLDQQALEMFKRAQPLVPIPPALRGKQFPVVLRAIYNLKEEPDS